MRIARGDGWHFAEHRLHHARVVLAQRLGGDHGAHVDEPVRLPDRIAIDGGEVGTDGVGRVEGHREGEEETVGGGGERRARIREEPADQVVERLVALQCDRHAGVDFAGPIKRVEAADSLQVLGKVGEGRFEFVHETLPEAAGWGGSKP